MPEEPSSENSSAKRLTPAKAGKPALAVVTLLDGKSLDVHVERKAKGEHIFDEVCHHLDLLEKDYFGLNYLDKGGRKTWLDLDKRVGKILKGDPWRLDFEVKFYPKDPSQLREDFTRYLLCLQVRNDILSGKLPCSFVTHAMLGSYLVQSQLGDYSAEEYPDASYLSGFKFCPDPAPGLEERVMALHKGHKGQTPAEAEQHYLENAKKLAMYGVDMHPAKDSEGVDIQLGVCSTGILVYQDMLRINRFAWPKILKISYRRNNFYIKIRPGEFEQYEQTVGFKLESSRAAKNLWKVCVDQHTFFRLMSADATKRPGLLFPRLGSLYRWNRKTQVEVMDTVNPRGDQKFTRSLSFRPSQSMDALGRQSPEQVEDPQKRHTMSHAPARPATTGSPARVEKGEESSVASISSTEGEFSTSIKEQKPAGGVAVLPMEPFKNKKFANDHGKNGLSPKDEDEEKENRSNRIEEMTPTKDESFDSKKSEKSPGSGLIGLFAGTKDKKSKDKKDKDEDKKKSKKEKIAVAETVSGEFAPEKSSKGDPTGKGKEKDSEKGKRKSVDGDSDDEKNKKSEKGKRKSTDGDSDDEKQKKSEKISKLSVFRTKDRSSKKDQKPGKGRDSKSSESTLERSNVTEKDRSLNESTESPYTRDYEYTPDNESNRPRPLSGFTYESDKTSPVKGGSEKSPVSPGKTERATAFNYAPGDIKKIEEHSGSGTGTGKKLFSFLSGKSRDSTKDKDRSDTSIRSDASAKSDTLNSSDNVNSSDLSANLAEGTLDSSNKSKKGGDKKSKSKDDKKSKDDSKTKEDKAKDSSKSKDDKANENTKSKDDKIKDASKLKGDKTKDDSKANDTKANDSTKSKDDKKSKDDAKSKVYKLLGTSKSKDDKQAKDDKKSINAKDDKQAKDDKKSISAKDDKNSINVKDDKQSTKDNVNTASSDFILAEKLATSEDGKYVPKIVKTTTKSEIVNTGGTVTQNVEESIENVNTGEVTLSTHTAESEFDESRSPFITATAVTTRTATTLEDLGTKAKTQQVEEKTVARSTTTTGLRQEQRVVTQEVRATTVVNEPKQKELRGSTSSLSSDDSGTPIDGDGGTYYPDKPQGPIVETETVVYSPMGAVDEGGLAGTPLVPTVTQRLDDGTFALPGAVVTSQTITSKTRTVETLTYKTEKDGVVETRVEQKITIQSDGDPIDHEKALNEAIQEATAMNPDMRVEKIEIQQEAVP